MPEENWQKGHYNAWVAMGDNKEDRLARLEQVPEEWKEDVREHVRTVFRLRNQAKNKRVRG